MKGGLTLNSLLLLFCILIALRSLNPNHNVYNDGFDYIMSYWSGTGYGFSNEASFNLLLIGIMGAFAISLGTGIFSTLSGSSFSVMYLIPAAAFGFITAFLLAPLGFLFNAAIPTFLKMILMGFIFILYMMAGFGFIRGMEA